MKKDYTDEKTRNNKKTNDALWVLLLFILLFATMIVRVATRSGSLERFFGPMPSGEDAYKIAVNYIRPTLGARVIKFPDTEYQYNKPSDSVYIIKSYFESTYSNAKPVRTSYAITLKYVGGSTSSTRNWSVLNFEERNAQPLNAGVLRLK